MRRLEGLGVLPAECERLAPSVHLAARLLTERGDHVAGDDLEKLALAMAACVADAGQIVADPSPEVGDVITLATWANEHGISTRTARRQAVDGTIAARKVAGRWMVAR